MAGVGDTSAVRARDASVRGGQIEGQASRIAEGPEQEMGGTRAGHLDFLPKYGKCLVIKVLKELSRVPSGLSPLSLCLRVPRCLYPSSRGDRDLELSTKPLHSPGTQPPILRSCHTVQQPVVSHQ